MKQTFLVVFVLLSFLSFGQTTTTLINPTAGGGFESGTTFAANGWSSTSSATTTNNQWVTNTATFYAGTRSAYVTNNTAGAPPPNAYTLTATRVSHFYQNFTIPNTASSATLSFYWKGAGEGTTVFYDYMRVYFEPATNAAPVYNTQKAFTGVAPTGIVNAATAATAPTTSTYYNISQAGYTGYQLVTINIPAAYFNNTAYRLTFEWRNDNSAGTQPPAAVDNISLTYVTPPSCSGTPNAGTSTISSSTGCASTNFTLSATGVSSGAGISYQWQSAPAPGGPWTNIAGATNTTLTTSATTTTFYRLVTTCSNSGLTNTTNTVSYTVNTCTGSITLTDSYGDGWNGATMTLNVNGSTFAVYGSTFTTGTTQTINFCLPQNSTYSLVYSNGGAWPTEVGVSLTINGTVVYTVGAGGATAGSTLISGTACPPPPTTPPPCIASPTAPTNAQTGVSVNPTLSWPTASTATSYQVYFGTSPTPPLVTTVTGTSYNPGTLIASTTYYWQIVPVNAIGAATGCSVWSFTTGIAGCATGTAYLTFTPLCNGTQEIYSYCTYAGEYNTLNLTAGTAYSFGTNIATDYITIRTTANVIVAAGTQPISYTPPTSGNYIVQVNTNSACGTDASCHNTWVQCGTVTPPPANDLVCNATAITCGQTLAGTTLNSTNSGTGENTTCGLSTQTVGGVWYTVSGNGQIMTASLCGNGGWDSQVSIFSGSSCSSITCVGAIDDNGPACTGVEASYSWQSVIGTTYYILVHGYSSNSAFNITLTCTTPVGNDQCANATALTVQCSGGTTNTSGTTLGAAEEPITDPSCDPGTINDVWYSFNSGAFTSVELTITLGTASWIGGEVFTACGTLANGLSMDGTPGNCDFYLLNPSPTVISGLTPNTNYLIRIFTNIDFDIAGTFDIRLNYPAVAAPTTTGASTCYGSNAIVSSSVAGNWYSTLAGGTALSSGTSTYTTPGLTANTDYYVEAVTGSCVSSPRTLVTVTVSPQPTVIAGATSNSTGCNIYSPNTWSYFVNPSNEIIACVKDATGGNNLGAVSADVNITGTVQYMPTNNAPYIQRVVSISPASNGPADVRLFFTLAEFQALQAAEPLLTNTNQLAVTKFPNATAPYGTGILLTPTLIQTPAQTGIANVYSIDVTVTGFSTFFIHYNSNNFPLPIELLSFTGECNADKAVLKWSTATEQNNSYFTIMKSNNGVDFTDVGMVQGAGNSSTTKQYSWTDQNSGLAPAYYRLKQTDFNGGSKEFNIIYLDCHFSTPDNLAVIPNPSNGNVTLSFESQISGEGVILVHNAQGNLVLTEQTFIGSGLNSIPMRITQNPGIYHVSVQIQGRYYRGIMVVQQ